MADLQRFHVFDTLIPALVDQLEIPASPPHVYPLWQHTLKTVEVVSRLTEMIEAPSFAGEWSVWWMDAFQEKLARFFPDFRSYLQENLTLGREKKQLLLLGALFHDIGKPMTMSYGEDGCLHYYGHDAAGEESTEAAGRRLQLSNLETTWLSLIVRYHMRLLPLINQDAPPSRRAVYRFFKKASTAGAAITLLSLADTAATFGDQLDPQHWGKALQVVEVILSAWWEERETVVQPQLYLNGHDIQRIFELKPGKMIGLLIQELSEAQAAGLIEDRQAAIAFLRQLLEQHQIDPIIDENES
jgi:poly(A) polymerase